MENLLVESGWDIPPLDALARGGLRLLSAVALGGLVGLEREHRGRAAGLRTHMLVALGSALFTLVSLEAGATSHDVAQVVKGIATGIGFLGAGAILKRAPEGEIHGLTTAGSIWLTAAVGMAAGLGRMWLAVFAIVLSLLILFLHGRFNSSNASVLHNGRRDSTTSDRSANGTTA